MIPKTVFLLVVLCFGGCHPFGIDSVSPLRGSFNGDHHFDGLLKQRRQVSSFRLNLSLFCTRKMEIWWDGREETLEPPKSLLEEPGDRPDRWILNREGASRDLGSAPAEVFHVDGNQLKNTIDKSVVGAVVRIKDSSGQEQALAALGSVEWVLVEIEESYELSWQMIPAENIIAAAQSTGTKLAFAVKKAADVAGLAKALELGVDALCISTESGNDDPDLWKTAIQARRERNSEANQASSGSGSKGSKQQEPEIVVGSCWRRDTKGTVLADRICVDLVQKLRPEEGCWVGSSAKIMALVLSEAASSQFVPTRPFRVNAGPVHSYILLGDGVSTKYLCELQPSDQVMVYNTQTESSKPVAVGRLKEEIRPCVLVELEAESGDDPDKQVGSRGQVFLQQAETVRLAQPSSGFIRVTDLDAQTNNNGMGVNKEPLLLRVMTIGTHVGKMYTGKVEER